ncbi:hypothetical protein [Chitinophaga nivalis]|uniref:Bacteriocin n=1 Tax=Chitinophaga nivalis TaxID=2991709 RepID=A0ABT3IMQ4_9BACT|nr:hypothetical protein [Chitinophaga nivalis]MCW3465062.1 hypothetical protein [Chitinophaga nivalis]MCW3485246.1 hypothetical protein [Chitinophaga nivalis]
MKKRSFQKINDSLFTRLTQEEKRGINGGWRIGDTTARQSGGLDVVIRVYKDGSADVRNIPGYWA